jgi:hypothetical protein
MPSVTLGGGVMLNQGRRHRYGLKIEFSQGRRSNIGRRYRSGSKIATDPDRSTLSIRIESDYR